MTIRHLLVKRVITADYVVEVDDTTENLDTVRFGEQNKTTEQSVDVVKSRRDSGPHSEYVDNWTDPDITELNSYAKATYID